jgi:hypothetical protein
MSEQPKYPDPRYNWLEVTTIGDLMDGVPHRFIADGVKPPSEWWGVRFQTCGYCGSRQSSERNSCSQCGAGLD